MALPSSSRYGLVIIWLALHTAEGARTVESLFGFFDRGQHASSHAGADGYRLSEPWVPDERAAWTLLNGNPRSLNLEMCGFAHWTREQWLSEGWVDGVWNPRQMIRHAAAWLREKCDRHNIPRRLLTAEEVGRGMSGIIDHARYTYGTGDGNHTDVGKNFPWDVLFADLMNENEGDDVGLPEFIEFRPDLGGAPRNLWDGIAQVLINQGVQTGLLLDVMAAITSNTAITPEELREAHEAAVKKYTPTAEQIAAAQAKTMLPVVEDALRRVQDADNTDEARQTATELLRMISAATPANQE